MGDLAPSEDQLQDAVARADRARRVRDAARRLWAVAPVAAGVCLLIAIAGRLRGWTPLVTLLVLGAAAFALTVYALTARRRHAVSDADVADIDAAAGLQGELRSAHWFALAPDRDDWIRFHLARAAERVHGIDWTQLYPAPATRRAKLAAGAMAVAAVALAIVIPGRAGIAASDGRAGKNAAAATRPNVIVALPADLRKQLEAMLAAAESGKGRSLTAAEVRDLLARLDELSRLDPAKQGGNPAAAAAAQPPATKADIKALAERAKKAAESTELEPAVRDALSDVADKLKDGEQSNAMSARDEQDAAAKGEATGEAQQSKSGGGKQDAGAQTVKEASGGSGVGVMMMTSDDPSSAKDGGMGLGGGSADKNGGGHLAELAAALRRETIDASVDNQGENVQTPERRKTEQSAAATAYSHAAAQPAQRGSSTAPPPVPESRRAAVKSYFIRKQ